MIIVIAKSKRRAAAVSEMVGDRIQDGQRIWTSKFLDIGAIWQAIALSGGGVVEIGRYQLGFASGFVLCGLLVGLYQSAR